METGKKRGTCFLVNDLITKERSRPCSGTMKL
jgi:hypothetical protein